ncbi:MAG: ankyrin repeat domain-containing protein [Legionellaceae bacterium]|nr:ankyrin repeat domain-containing protein [Legionellaceae bacterium]
MPKKWITVKTDARTARGQVKYWDAYIYDKSEIDSIDDPQIEKAIYATLEAFSCHNYKEVHVKSYQGAPVQTMRINDEDRIIFSTIEHQQLPGKKLALIHGYVLIHNYLKYKTSLFDLNHIRSHEDLCKNGQLDFQSEVIPKNSSIQPSHTPNNTTLELGDFAVETVFNKQFIELTPPQYQAIHQQYPSMLSGAGGVGKTVVLVKKIQHFLAEIGLDTPLNVLCLTESGKLADELNKHLNAFRSENHRIDSLTYNQWICQYAEGREIVDDLDLERWYDGYVVHQNTLLRTKQKIANSGRKTLQPFALKKDDVDRAAIKHTFKLFAGRDPNTLSERDFIFPIELKPILIKAYEDYLTYLGTSKLHPGLYKIPAHIADTVSYDLFYLDEGQNFTFAQIKNAYAKSKSIDSDKATPVKALHINYDSHQALNSYYSDRENILQFFRESTGQEPFHDKLHGNHRSHPDIVVWTDQFISCVKYVITQGLGDHSEDSQLTVDHLKKDSCLPPLDSPSTEHTDLESSFTSDDTIENSFDRSGTTPVPALNQVFWPNQPLQPSQFNFKSGRWLILTHPEFLNEAMELYGNACTFEQAIGLESDYVCLHRPFDHKAFSLINELLPNEKIQSLRPLHEAKKNLGNKKFIPYMNAIISGALRAKLFLAISQDKSSAQLHKLMQQMQARSDIGLIASVDDEPIHVDEIRNKLRGLILNKNLIQAQREFINLQANEKIGMTYETFESSILSSIKADHYPNTINQTIATLSSEKKCSAPNQTKQQQKIEQQQIKILQKRATELFTKINAQLLNVLFEQGALLETLSFQLLTFETTFEHILRDRIKARVFLNWLKDTKHKSNVWQILLPLYPIHIAAKLNCVTLVENAIEAGIDVDQLNQDGVTPLFIAIQNKHINSIQKLKAHAAIDNIIQGTTLLLEAVEQGLLLIVADLIKKCTENTLNARNAQGETALIVATRLGAKSMVQILLPVTDRTIKNLAGETAANVAKAKNMPDLLELFNPALPKSKPLKSTEKMGFFLQKLYTQFNHTNLDTFIQLGNCGLYTSYFIQVGNHQKCFLQAIFEHDEKYNIFYDYLIKNPHILEELYFHYKDYEYSGIEQMAAFYNRYQIIALLIEKSFDINRRNIFGRKASYLAISKGHVETIEALKKGGLNPFEQLVQSPPPLKSGIEIPLRIAIDYGSPQIQESFERHTNSNPKGSWSAIAHISGLNPLILAVQANDIHKVQDLLLSDPSNVNTTIGDECIAPIHIAAQHGFSQIIMLLAAYGAMVNLPMKNGNSALHIAAQLGNDGTIRMLLRCGANINTMSNDCGTPLISSLFSMHKLASQTLVYFGAALPVSDLKVNNFSLTHNDIFDLCDHQLAEIKGMQFKIQHLLNNFTIYKLLNICDFEPTLSFFYQHIKYQDHPEIKLLEIILENSTYLETLCQFLIDTLVSSPIKAKSYLWILAARVCDLSLCNTIHLAAKWGADNLLALLLQTNTSFETPDLQGKTPLAYAIIFGKTRAATMLVSNGAIIKEENLVLAMQYDRLDIFSMLLSNCPTLTLNTHFNDDTILTLATKQGRTDYVKEIIQHKAKINLNLPDKELKATAFYIAVAQGDLNTVRLLLAEKKLHVDINTMCERTGCSPLMIAIIKGHDEIFYLLINEGARLDLINSLNQMTALMYAVCAEAETNWIYVEILINHHTAMINHVNKYQQSALVLATKLGRTELVIRLIDTGATDLDNAYKIAESLGFTIIMDFITSKKTPTYPKNEVKLSDMSMVMFQSPAKKHRLEDAVNSTYSTTLNS